MALIALIGPSLSLAAAVAGGKVEVLSIGRSALPIATVSGMVIVIDPWLINNPKAPTHKDPDAIGKVDLIPVTHGDGKHFADAHVVIVYEPTLADALARA